MKGLEEMRRFLAELPTKLEQNILRGALRAGAEVYADGAREGCRSPEAKASIRTSSRIEPGVVTAKVKTQGPGAYLAPWLEFGTDPHYISVDASQSGGRTVARINRETKRGTLVIGGKFVGDTVHHPGARPFPFMRPAIETRGADASAAIANYIRTRLTKEGLETAPAEEAADE